MFKTRSESDSAPIVLSSGVGFSGLRTAEQADAGHLALRDALAGLLAFRPLCCFGPSESIFDFGSAGDGEDSFFCTITCVQHRHIRRWAGLGCDNWRRRDATLVAGRQ